MASTPPGKPSWSPALTAVGLAPARKFPAALASTAMVALAPEGKYPAVLAPTTGISLAPAVLAVTAELVTMLPTKS